MYDYQQLIKEGNIKSIPELHRFFFEEIAYDWMKAYEGMSEKHGVITLQNFWGFAFIIDDGNQLRDTDRENDKREILEGRTVAAFGISNTNISQTNRKTMRTWIGKTSKVFAPYGTNYDKGHFIAHGFGGPIDVNLFPQRRDINRGWYEEGKPYRQMERYVAANPGTFVFSRPIYNDLSFCPQMIEFGYCTTDLEFTVRQFPNR
ncbi:MAG TPA: DNA/RNA non-specific endonuclease [Ferruginibacter sp.]|nr:DNA/RNA non-specific endonuclease [Ferruginibacter sp.]